MKKLLISLLVLGLFIPAQALAQTADETPPSLEGAEALNMVTVKVSFSEAVVLPEEDTTDAFVIETIEDLTPLLVEEVFFDEEDEENMTVILVTEEQSGDVDYILTVGDVVTDEAGNGMVSGQNDSTLFVGSDAEVVAADGDEPVVAETADEDEDEVAEEVHKTAAEDEEDADTVAPEMFFLQVNSKTEIVVFFSEPIELSEQPLKDLTIVETENANNVVEILEYELSGDALSVRLTTEMQTGGTAYTVVASQQVRDKAGNQIAQDKSTKHYLGFIDPNDLPDDGPDGPPPTPPTTPKTGPGALMLLFPSLGMAGIIRRKK